MTRLFGITALLLLSCGQYTGPQANATYFWQVTSSAVEFGACSDATDFRMGIDPLPFGEDTFIIYRVSADGKKALSQTCTQLDSQSCSPTDGGLAFDIVGRELTFTETTKATVGTTPCALEQTLTWTLTDATRSMTLDIANVLTLVDAPTECAKVESGLKARSPNGLGVEGCVITSKLAGTLK